MRLDTNGRAAAAPARPSSRLRRPGLSALAGMLAAGLCAFAGASPAAKHVAGTDAGVSHLISAGQRSGWTSVVIRASGPLNAERTANLSALGARIYRRLDLIHSLALRIPVRNLGRLAALPFVEHVSSDVAVHKSDQFTVGSSLASTAWARPYNLSGAGVTVAVVDTGICATNPDLETQINVLGLLGVSVNVQPTVVQSVNFVAGQTSATDECGHGTHVAGIIAGNGAASTGILYTQTFFGIAPKTKLVNVRVLDNTGSGTVSQVISGIQWVVNNRSTYNIRVMNLSLGHPVGENYANDPLCQAVEAAWKAGIVVVVAAGNDGRLNADVTPGVSDNEGYGTAYGSVCCPGNDPYVITVGATKSMDAARAHDRIATYSSRGPTRLDLVLKPDIIAPGNRVTSLNGAASDYLMSNYASTNAITYASYATIPLDQQNSYQYFMLSGTSMATPVVSGAAALMLQANPNLSPDTVKARLMISADKWASPNSTFDPCTYGAGYVDIPAALNCTATPKTSALSPTLSMDSQGNVYISLMNSTYGSGVWGTNVTSLRAIWGEGLTEGDDAGAYRAVWGTSCAADSTVWNDRAVWGTDVSAADLSYTVIAGE